jgi:serine phosphatase RsbU (regulator of sigma subunit)
MAEPIGGTQAGLGGPSSELTARARAYEADVRVLVVEDDDGDALLVQELLHDALPDASVARVGSLGEAVRVLGEAKGRSAEVTCVLLDLGLPDSVGLESVATLRQYDPAAAIIVLTGADDESMGMRALRAGAQDYLVKGRSDERALARSVLYAVERQRSELTALQLLETSRRYEENQRMERALLPRPLLATDSYTLSVHYQPGARDSVLGGDFYDAVETADGGLRVVIGDVSGHGPDEAALGASLRSAWRCLVLAELPTQAVLRTLDAHLAAERRSRDAFATLAMIDIEPDRRIASIVLAGHPAPMVLDGTTILFEPSRRGSLLGLGGVDHWPATALALPQRWSLMLYTDGLIEGMADSNGTSRLGEAGALELVEAQWQLGLRGQALVGAIAGDVVTHNGGPLADDLAICLIEGSWQ